MTDKLIFRKEPLSVFETAKGWVYTTFTGMKNEANGFTVAVLPYRTEEDGSVSVLVHNEEVPAWLYATRHIGLAVMDDHKYMTTITGAVEFAENPTNAALREMREEAGLVVDGVDARFVGMYHQGKAIGTVVLLFLVDVTVADEVEIEGDGSEHEKSATNTWMSIRDVYGIEGDWTLTLAVSELKALLEV